MWMVIAVCGVLATCGLILAWVMDMRTTHARELLLSGLAKGDEVITDWGVYGRIVAVDREIVTLQIGEYATVRMLKGKVWKRYEQTQR